MPNDCQNKPKLNQSDVEQSTTKLNIEKEEQYIYKQLQKDWAIIENNEYSLKLINEWDQILEIDKKYKRYECYYHSEISSDNSRYSTFIEYNTHQLLHKLFELWG